MTINYADKFGNSYRIVDAQLTYSPISELQSSSGTYSGGEPKKLELTEEQMAELELLFKKAIKNERIHVTQRKMGSSRMSISNEGKVETYIIRYNCAEQKAIESFLISL